MRRVRRGRLLEPRLTRGAVPQVTGCAKVTIVARAGVSRVVAATMVRTDLTVRADRTGFGLDMLVAAVPTVAQPIVAVRGTPPVLEASRVRVVELVAAAGPRGGVAVAVVAAFCVLLGPLEGGHSDVPPGARRGYPQRVHQVQVVEVAVGAADCDLGGRGVAPTAEAALVHRNGVDGRGAKVVIGPQGRERVEARLHSRGVAVEGQRCAGNLVVVDEVHPAAVHPSIARDGVDALDPDLSVRARQERAVRIEGRQRAKFAEEFDGDRVAAATGTIGVAGHGDLHVPDAGEVLEVPLHDPIPGIVRNGLGGVAAERQGEAAAIC
mmetsp:Transcript_2284/g.6639  ORF Transcript_2284/g.6639 Transcript_2284/m.6639 type:complete len:323 (-) Transcript_2284:796-1764(-)